MNIFIQRRKHNKGNRLELSHLLSTKIALNLDLPIYTPKIKCFKYTNLAINWGCSSIPWIENLPITVINHPMAIKAAINKLKSFNSFIEYGVQCPEFTSDKNLAELWIEDKEIVFCRTLLTSYSGRGIIIAREKEELVNAPLYTKYIKKIWEYRVHVMGGEILLIQQKKKLTPEKCEELGFTKSKELIRCHSNGYIYSTDLKHEESSNIINNIKIQALKAIISLGLDFGAVDIIVTKNEDVFVLEVNTSPGIEGNTVQKYINGFKNHYLN